MNEEKTTQEFAKEAIERYERESFKRDTKFAFCILVGFVIVFVGFLILDKCGIV